ncbi:hypothetical protein BC629DRAFT_418986 [Irpex lacteus]|nr:hypothetical protein BC629DRAFT_418986 [Irpex lacteus]
MVLLIIIGLGSDDIDKDSHLFLRRHEHDTYFSNGGQWPDKLTTKKITSRRPAPSPFLSHPPLPPAHIPLPLSRLSLFFLSPFSPSLFLTGTLWIRRKPRNNEKDSNNPTKEYGNMDLRMARRRLKLDSVDDETTPVGCRTTCNISGPLAGVAGGMFLSH